MEGGRRASDAFRKVVAATEKESSFFEGAKQFTHNDVDRHGVPQKAQAIVNASALNHLDKVLYQ